MSYGSFFYGAVVGAPKMPDYGVAINIKYYGIFTRKQAQKRIRKINRQIRQRSRRLSKMRLQGASFIKSPQSYLNTAGYQINQIRTLRKIRGTISKRWNLTRSGKKKKGGGRFLFWRKRR